MSETSGEVVKLQTYYFKMEKFLVIFMLAWSAIINAEPPTNSYLPPRNQNDSPSRTYGPPGFQPGTPIGLTPRPGSTYSTLPATENYSDSDQRSGTTYMPPDQNRGTTPGSSGVGNGQFVNGRQVTSTYRVTSRNGFGDARGNEGPSTAYSLPSGRDIEYGRISNGVSNGFNARSNSLYNGLQESLGRSGGFHSPQLYLLPTQNEINRGYPGSTPSRNGGNGGYNGVEESREPNQPGQFQYEVNNLQYGRQVGVQESKNGNDRATGENGGRYLNGRPKGTGGNGDDIGTSNGGNSLKSPQRIIEGYTFTEGTGPY